jgi:hypothetical protein
MKRNNKQALVLMFNILDWIIIVILVAIWIFLYLSKYDKSLDAILRTSPSIFIAFLAIFWGVQLSNGIQLIILKKNSSRSDAVFRVILFVWLLYITVLVFRYFSS